MLGSESVVLWSGTASSGVMYCKRLLCSLLQLFLWETLHQGIPLKSLCSTEYSSLLQYSGHFAQCHPSSAVFQGIFSAAHPGSGLWTVLLTSLAGCSLHVIIQAN